MKRSLQIGAVMFVLIFSLKVVLAKDVPFTLEDRDRIIRIEARLGEIDKRFEQIDKRFEQIDKRFEQIDKRFEQIDKRFEQIDKRFDDLYTFLWILSGIFTTMVAATIGFALWDRRSMIRPFETKIKKIEDELSEDKEKLHCLLEAFRALAKKDEKVAEILKELKLL